MDVFTDDEIREHATALLSEGVTLLILTVLIRVFFFSSQCYRIDVVSGCGKNAEGAAQTQRLVFHNASQKLLTLSLPKLGPLRNTCMNDSVCCRQRMCVI